MPVERLHNTKFPDNGKVYQGDGYEVYTIAQGRNGTCEIKSLDIHIMNHVVQMVPITRKRGIVMNCWIEVPKDKQTLRDVAASLIAISNELEAGEEKDGSK